MMRCVLLYQDGKLAVGGSREDAAPVVLRSHSIAAAVKTLVQTSGEEGIIRPPRKRIFRVPLS